MASNECPGPHHLADPQQSMRTQSLPQKASPDPTPSQAYSSHKTGHSAQVNPSFPTSFGKVDREQIRSPGQTPYPLLSSLHLLVRFSLGLATSTSWFLSVCWNRGSTLLYGSSSPRGTFLDRRAPGPTAPSGQFCREAVGQVCP